MLSVTDGNDEDQCLINLWKYNCQQNSLAPFVLQPLAIISEIKRKDKFLSKVGLLIQNVFILEKLDKEILNTSAILILVSSQLVE